MKICVIGNSHVGALKLAWDELRLDYPGKEFTFFACGGSGMKEMVVSNGRFIAGNVRLKRRLEYTSGGVGEVVPEDYDLFLVYGLGLALTPFDETAFYSLAVKEAARKDRLEKSLNFRVCELLRTITNKPVFIAHNPFPSQALKKGKRVSIDKVREEVSWCKKFLECRASFVSQPEVTIVDGFYTKQEYSKGSRKLETGDKDDGDLHPEDDFTHMNVEYGKVWVRDFFDAYLA